MRKHDEKIDQLAKVALFQHCERKELERIAAVTDEVHAEPGDVLCREGTVAKECYIIVSGEAEVLVNGHRVATIGAGESVGEMGLLDHAPRSATVVTTTPVVAYAIGSQRFDSLIESSPHLARALLNEMSSRIRNLDESASRLAVG